MISGDPQDISCGASPGLSDERKGEVSSVAGQAGGQDVDVVGVMIPPQLGTEGQPSARPSPKEETSDATMIVIPGTEGEGDRGVSCVREEGTPPETPVPAWHAQGEEDLCPGDVGPIPMESTSGAEKPLPGIRDSGSTPNVSWAAFAKVQEERDQLARRFDALQAVLPVALTMKVNRLLRLEARAAQLQGESARLAREQEEMHKRAKRWEATVMSSPAIRALLQEMKSDSQAESESRE